MSTMRQLARALPLLLHCLADRGSRQQVHAFRPASSTSSRPPPGLPRQLHSSRSASATNRDSDGDDGDWFAGGTVSVRVAKHLPHIDDPALVRDVWLEQHWNKGGGLPILVSVAKDEEEEDETATMRAAGLARLILPVFMEETITADTAAGGGEAVALEYTVSRPGPAFRDVLPGSHSGRVTVSPSSEGRRGVTLEWSVTFETSRLRSAYQKVTEFTIGVAARTVAESLAVPDTLTLRTTLEGVADPVEARREWLEFVWTAKGGGLPLLPPLPRGEALEEGGGSARKELLRIPPLITERIVSTSERDDDDASSSSCAELLYRLQRPGWTSVPFLMHTHEGRVVFSKSGNNSDKGGSDDAADGGKIDLLWEITVRPWPLASFLVKTLVEMTASTLTRNLAARLAEPDAKVEIRPPRGNSDLLGGGIDSFGSVDKDTWIGGVLDAHLRDTRPTLDQAASLLRPWTWGRTGRGGDDDDVTFTWS